MSGFEFAFSLFGLILGLALAEGLGGLSRALKASHRVRIGWLTALLGLFVSCDLVTFWAYAWNLRDTLTFAWPTLFAGFVVTAVYYVSASLIFADDPEEWGDLDGHFWKQRRKVIGGVFLCNVALIATVFGFGLMPDAWDVRTFIITWAFFPLSALAMTSNDRRVVIVVLTLLILLYPISVFWTK